MFYSVGNSHVSNVESNETGPRCCLSLVDSVMALISGGGGVNLKVLIVSVHTFSCIRTTLS